MAEEQTSLILSEQDTLSIDYADADTLLHADGVLQLMGGTQLILSNCGEGDGKTYTLATGVSALLDAEGNELLLDSSNNTISHYFDTTQPGTGFWADATLSLSEDGILQLVRHHETVKAAQTITTHQTESLVYNYYEGISFEDITYSSSESNVYGGAIYGGDNSTITLNDNGSVTFSGNSASTDSSSDSVYGYGGAIYGGDNSSISLNGNGSVTFSGNTASTYGYYSDKGGAICGGNNSTIILSDNESVEFSGNKASRSGGAIAGSTITLCDNGNVLFSGNDAGFEGGAIAGSTITLCDNGSVTFSENYTAFMAGAISGSTITLCDNGNVTFSGNRAGGMGDNSYGGAIYGSTIMLNDNDSVTFSGNNSDSWRNGGAIYGGNNSTIELNGNGSVTFSGNIGSAIYGGDNSTITLSNNESVTFSGNIGSAIYGDDNSTITLSNNESVTFSGNIGGAIYSVGSVTIAGNDEVTFARNVEESDSNYRLRSLYLEGDDSTDKLTLSAGKGQSISFYDSVYMGANGSVALNADYTDADGVTRKASGTILFSGATTEDDLKDAKNGVAGTEEEILNSRTSELNSAATLYGGTLQVQDKAVLKLNGGLTVAEGGNATVEVKAAELSVGSHALSMVSGSSLALADGAKVTATELTITTGATLAVLGSVSTEPLTEQVAALTLSKETVAGFDASRAVNMGSVSVLDGDLTLESGSLLSLDDAYLELSGNLFFDVAEGEEKIALDIAPGVITDENNQVVLFNVDGVVTFGFDGLTASADNGMVYCVKAEDYFTGSRVQESTKLVYDSKSGVVYLEDVTEGTVPEPTSSMLSLLGLVAFTLRRRRK